MANPYEGFLNSVSGGNYAGSSGYWGDTGNNYQGSRAGMGYPGDRAKNSIAARYGLTPSSIGTSAESWGTSNSLSRPTIAGDGLAYVGGSNTKFTGTDPVTKKRYVNGAEQSLVPGTDTYINPNDPNQRYQAVSIVKDPTLSGAADDLSTQFATAAKNAITDYSKLLPDYQAQAATAEAASKAAADTSGTQKTLQDAQTRFSTGLDTAQSDYSALDAANAAKQRDIVAKRYADEATYNDLQDQSNQIAQGGVMRMTSKNGAIRGGIPYGTDAQAAFARESYQAGLPYQLAKENYHQQNLANESGVETALTADEARRIGFNVAAQGQQYQSAQSTAQAVQALKVSSANQDWETMTRILSVPTLYNEAVQRAAAGDVQLGQALAAFKATTNYQGLRDVLGEQVSTPAYFSQNQGNLPNAQTPTTRNGTPSASPNYFNPNSGGGGGGGTSGTTGGQTNPNANDYVNPDKSINPYGLQNWQLWQRASYGGDSRGAFDSNYLNSQANSYSDQGLPISASGAD